MNETAPWSSCSGRDVDREATEGSIPIRNWNFSCHCRLDGCSSITSFVARNKGLLFYMSLLIHPMTCRLIFKRPLSDVKHLNKKQVFLMKTIAGPFRLFLAILWDFYTFTFYYSIKKFKWYCFSKSKQVGIDHRDLNIHGVIITKVFV